MRTDRSWGIRSNSLTDHCGEVTQRRRQLRLYDFGDSVMVRIAAVVHTYNDALRLGRCLETVYPCDEIVVVDHGSQDRTLQVAREYGARAIVATGGDKKFWQPSDAEWILCLDPRESLTESLAASLFEWKAEAAGEDV